MAVSHGFGKIVTDGLVLTLDAADTNSYTSGSTTWRDMSGNGNNGTLTNGPTFDSANGGSIVFDGVDDLVLHDNIQFLSSSSFTLSQWQEFDDSVTTSWQGFSGGQRYSGGTVDYGGYFMWHSTGVFWWYQSFDNPTYYGVVGGILSGGNIFDRMVGNGYFQVDVTYNGSSNTMKVYINSNLELTTTPTWRSGLDRMTFKQIGRGHTNRNFTGKIPIQKLYNRVLTDSEILQNYNTLKPRFGL